MPDAHDSARGDLQAWRDSQPTNFFTSDTQLQRLLARLMEPRRHQAARPHLERFGAVAAGALDAAAITNNETPNLPRLKRWSAMGEREEDIAHHPSYDVCGKAIYEDGRMIATYEEGPANLHAQALFYLSSHAGEAGHNCPVACTAGVVKALRARGSQALQDRWLSGLLTETYDLRLDGAQFLTEIQGGSDVGANAVRALPDGDDLGTTRWRIHGEKWFCSNATADLFLMTARPEGAPKGTRGLGLFLVPRRLEDGTVNHFQIRRLKDKLGTRSMASGEIDFNGAVAYAVGPVDTGFQGVMQHVIATSRLYNTLGCAGIARRARLVATGYARHRRAFGQPVGDYPLMQEMLATMRARSMALVAGGLELAAGFDSQEDGALDGDGQAFLRVATNLIKMRSAQHAHRVVLTAIECLGGNGAIETFSVLPRLLRDNVVYENWEGTHNTLIAQTLRDFTRLGLHEGVLARLDNDLAALPQEVQKIMAPAFLALKRVRDGLPPVLEAAASDPGLGALLLRGHAETLADLILASALARDVAHADDEPARLTLEVFIGITLQLHGDVRDRAWAKAVAVVGGLNG
jgi:acyl-CoA dehydrogenase